MTPKFKFRHGMACAGLIALSCMTLVTSLARADEAVAHNQSAIGESLQTPKKSTTKTIVDRLGSMDISATVELFDVEILRGLRAAFDYKYEVEPSYTGEYHLRMDRSTPKVSLNIGEVLRKDSRIGITIAPGAEILYVRPFKSKSEALKAIPYGLTKVPTTAAEVLERMPLTAQSALSEDIEPGDFFSYVAEMNLIVGASSLPLSITQKAGFATHFMLTGQFQVHIVKVDKTKIQMKIMAVKKDEKEVSLTAGLGKGNKIFGLKVVDRAIEKALNITEMIKVSAATMTSDILMVDYILDLSDSRVAEAYDGLISKVLELKSMKIADPTSKNNELKESLISDITPLEALYGNEALKPIGEKRVVDRPFKGENKVEVSDRSGIKVAPILFNLSRKTEYFENIMTTTNPDGSLAYNRLHTFQRTNSASFFLSYFKSVSVSRASALFDSDVTRKIGDMRDLVFEWNYRDKSLTKSELRMIKEAVKQALPDSVQNRVQWDAFTKEQDYSNARFLYKMVLHPKSLTTLQSLNASAIFDLLAKYIYTIPAPKSENQNYAATPERTSSYKETVVDKYKESLENIAFHMATLVNKNISNEERSNAFAQLRFNHLFIEIGPGFLVSLLPQTDLEKYVNFEIGLTADDTKEMKYTYGDVPDRKIYNSASYIHSVLTANEFEIITQMMKSANMKERKK